MEWLFIMKAAIVPKIGGKWEVKRRAALTPLLQKSGSATSLPLVPQRHQALIFKRLSNGNANAGLYI